MHFIEHNKHGGQQNGDRQHLRNQKTKSSNLSCRKSDIFQVRKTPEQKELRKSAYS